GLDGAQQSPAGLQPEVDLPDRVLLHDAADLLTRGVAHDDRRLHDLARPRQLQHDLAGGVGDLEVVGHELVDAGDQPQHLLAGRLADLAGRADLGAVLVDPAVLLVDLDDLGLLVDHEDRLGEDPTPAAGHRTGQPAAAVPGAAQLLGDRTALVADGE